MAESVHPLVHKLIAEPLFINRGTESLFEASIGHLSNHPHADKMFDQMAHNDNDGFWPDASDSNDWRTYLRPYNVVDGILRIPVQGILLNKFPYQVGTWATGYEYIRRALQRGLEDTGVKRIVFVIDSPGGIAAGVFDLTDEIYAAREVKPIHAIVADYAYSAAYSIASAAHDITVTRSSGVGSIGVVSVHVEVSERLKQQGIVYTYVFKGKFKKDGNPHEPLSEQALSGIEKRITKLYEVFTSTVARNRGMKKKAVKATQAQVYDAEEGIEIGLSDKTGNLEDELKSLGALSAETGEDQMAKTDNTDTVTTDAHNTAVADATAKGLTDGATAERTRINDIMGSDAAKTRPLAAKQVAMGSNMSTKEAQTFLSGMPEEPTASAPAAEEPAKKEAPKAETNHFEDAMNKETPEVGAGDDKGDKATAADETNTLLSDYKGLTT
jgi:signal peptide peptidase SppA